MFASTLAWTTIAGPPTDLGSPIHTIAFGSCAHQDKPQPIWRAVLNDAPDLFVFLGDNVYGDTEDMAVLAEKYQQFANIPGFAELRSSVPTVAVWDDHDYGQNDAGYEYPQKEASRRIMLDFWEEPANSPRRTREDGLYTAYTIGPPGKRVQIILLDLRWNRTALNDIGTIRYQLQKAPNNLGPYEAIDDPGARLLGESQWRWLAARLAEPADLRIIGSSIQLIPEFSGWESWANFPRARERLLALLAQPDTGPAVIISGDTHWSEFSHLHGSTEFPETTLWEATSSGLTEEWKAVSPNRHRVGGAYAKANYGVLEIDWRPGGPRVQMSIRDVTGTPVLQADIEDRPAPISMPTTMSTTEP